MRWADGTADDTEARERIDRAAKSVYSALVPTAADGGSDDDQLLQQRMAAFFRQSGGPTSPEIQRFLDNHLRYGKDHGEPGHLETIEDVVQQVIEGDHSLKTMLKVYSRWQGRREEREDEERDRKADFTAAVVRIEEHLGQLSKAVALLLEERAERLTEERTFRDPARGQHAAQDAPPKPRAKSNTQAVTK